MVQFSTNTDFFIVFASNKKELKEIELILLSRSIPFTVQNEFWQKTFFIPLNYLDHAQYEIRSFYRENENWPPVLSYPSEDTYFKLSLTHLWIVLILGAFHWWVTHSALIGTWYGAGRFTADKVLAGEW